MELCALEAGRKTGRLAASGRFGTFKAESEQKVRAPPEVKTNPAFDAMERAWRSYGKMVSYFGVYEKIYSGMLEKVKGLECPAESIEIFSATLPRFQDEPEFGLKVGLFLSALIETSKDKNFVLRLGNIGDQVSSIGYSNRKNIIVMGDTGRSVGQEMKDGSIIVEGNVTYELGFGMVGGDIKVNGDAGHSVGQSMVGGSIRVCGNADDNVGWTMQYGKIKVDGDAGEVVGFHMHGGEIRIMGGYGQVSTLFKGGRIFHRRKLIAAK